MKLKVLAFLLFGSCIYAQQHISEFTSVAPLAPSTDFVIPDSHLFQVIIEQGDALTEGGFMPGKNDFTAYVPINGSNQNGYLSINAETNTGGVTILDINFNTTNKLWQTSASEAVDFSGVARTGKNCSGTVTPWNTVISCEEVVITSDINNDGYRDVGWCVEIDPVSKTVIDKLWALGNFKHENVAIHSNNRTVYQGADSTPGYLYKFVADQPQDLSSGRLYVYRGSKSGQGDWILLDNTTVAERNSTLAQSDAVGATVFEGVEDVEIGPDGWIYFGVKDEDRVYRFRDPSPINGTNVLQMQTFVGGTSYSITHTNGTSQVPWGTGNDNLAFDDEGNLWVLQDGSNNYIWVVEKGHTQAQPKVKLFGRTPLGAEPTGITFSPDYRFLFMSVMHPNSTNDSSLQTDAAGNQVAFDRGTSFVIAVKGELSRTWYEDADGDGYATTDVFYGFNSPGAAYTTQVLPTTDCNDNDPELNPDTVWFLDADGDGFAASTATSCTSPGAFYTRNQLPVSDCDDDDILVHPNLIWYLDLDGDGYASNTTASCTSPGAGYTTVELPLSDCNDGDAAINPETVWYLDEDEDGYALSTEISCLSPGPGYTIQELPVTDCDDTNPAINGGTVWYRDGDGDGYASLLTVIRCTSPGAEYTSQELPTTDCDDSNAAVNPDTIWYLDADKDGYAVEATVSGCENPGPDYTFEVLPTTDCDDTDASLNPDTLWYLDADEDGYASDETVASCSSPGTHYTLEVLPTTDCDDTDASINPETIWYQDADGDGYAATETMMSCTNPGTGFTRENLPTTDCNDNDKDINPATVWYLDADNDGYATETTVVSCDSPGDGYTASELPTTDCDDTDAALNPTTIWYLDADQDGYLDLGAEPVISCTSPGFGYTLDELLPEPSLKSMLLYPNPTSGPFQIALGEFKEVVEVSIVNASEKLVGRKRFENTAAIELDFSGHSSGLYYLNISSKGKTIGVVKVLRR